MAGIIGAIIGTATQGVANYANAGRTAEELKRAGEERAATGERAAKAISGGYDAAEYYAAQGQAGQMGQYEQAREYARAQRDGLGGEFQQAREVGSSALQRYQAALLSGDTSALTKDPGYNFRQQQASAATSKLGRSAGVNKGFAGYNAALASQEYQAALDRLLGLAQIGTQATGTYAGLDAAAFRNYQGTGQAIAGAESQHGQYNALMRQNRAIAEANARSNNANIVTDYNLNSANVLAQGTADVFNASQDGAKIGLQYQMSKKQG